MDIFLTRLTIRQFLILLLLGCLFFVAYLYFPKSLASWFGLAIISAITLVQYKHAQIKYLLSSALILSGVVVLAGLLQFNMVFNLAYLVVVAFCSAVISYYQRKWIVLSFWVVAFAIVASMQITIAEDKIYRAIFIVAAYLLYIAMEIDFPNHRRKRETHLAIDGILRNLKQLSNDIFSCFTVLYADNVYIYERRLHQQKTKYSDAIQKINDCPELQALIAAANHILEELIDCSQLRWRVTDAATFELCQLEMRAIQQVINLNFDILMSINLECATQAFIAMDQQIANLDSNYQTVLQIAAKEPFVFMLFISSLKRLENALHSFYTKDKHYVS